MLYSKKIRPKDLTPKQKEIYDQIKPLERYLQYCKNNRDLIAVGAGGPRPSTVESDSALDYFCEEVAKTLAELDSLKEDFAAA